MLLQLLYLLVGAVLGAIGTYACTRYQKNREVLAKREALLHILSRELSCIADTAAPYDPTAAYYYPTFRFTAIEPLLDGETLTYRRERHLIQVLQSLHYLVSQANAVSNHLNLLNAMGRKTEGAHRMLALICHELVGARDELRGCLGPDLAPVPRRLM